MGSTLVVQLFSLAPWGPVFSCRHMLILDCSHPRGCEVVLNWLISTSHFLVMLSSVHILISHLFFFNVCANPLPHLKLNCLYYWIVRVLHSSYLSDTWFINIFSHFIDFFLPYWWGLLNTDFFFFLVLVKFISPIYLFFFCHLLLVSYVWSCCLKFTPVFFWAKASGFPFRTMSYLTWFLNMKWSQGPVSFFCMRIFSCFFQWTITEKNTSSMNYLSIFEEKKNQWSMEVSYSGHSGFMPFVYTSILCHSHIHWLL